MPIAKNVALHAFIGKRIEHRRRSRPGPVIERQDDLLVAQEVVHLEMFEAETRAAGGVDLDRADTPSAFGLLHLAWAADAADGAGACWDGAAAGTAARGGGADPVVGPRWAAAGLTAASDADMSIAHATAPRMETSQWTEAGPPSLGRAYSCMTTFRARVNYG